jgi:hypothetical protein
LSSRFVILGLELTLSIRRETQTWDEACHIFAGYSYWRHGDFGMNPEHPPLVKLVATLPMLPLSLKVPPHPKVFSKEEDFTAANPVRLWQQCRNHPLSYANGGCSFHANAGNPALQRCPGDVRGVFTASSRGRIAGQRTAWARAHCALAISASDGDNVGMSILRFLMILSLVVWIGGLIFFAVMAQTAFSVLPSRHLAGSVVGSALGKLHWMALVSGVIYLLASVLYTRLSRGSFQIISARHIVVLLMLALSLVSQWGITPRMHALRTSLGEIDTVPPSDPARIQFNRLHVWSEQIEKGVLLLGLLAIYLTAQQFS